MTCVRSGDHTSPTCGNRAFWTPSTHDPKAAAAEELPSHMFERGLIFIVLGLLFLWFAQVSFSRLEGRFAEKL